LADSGDAARVGGAAGFSAHAPSATRAVVGLSADGAACCLKAAGFIRREPQRTGLGSELMEPRSAIAHGSRRRASRVARPTGRASSAITVTTAIYSRMGSTAQTLGALRGKPSIALPSPDWTVMQSGRVSATAREKLDG